MKKVLKQFAVASFALIVVVASIFYDAQAGTQGFFSHENRPIIIAESTSATLLRNNEEVLFDQDIVLQEGDVIQASNNEVGEVMFGGRGVLRLAPLSVVIVRSVEVENATDSQQGNGILFELRQGQVWFNSQFTSMPYNVIAGGALLLPHQAIFDVAFDGNLSKVRVFSQQVEVGLLADGFPGQQIFWRFDDNTDSIIINNFLVAEGSQANISLLKIVENRQLLAQLLYSKLIKEFQYGLMDKNALKSDSWVVENKKFDQDFKLLLQEELNDAIRSKGLQYASLEGVGYDIDKAFVQISDTLTFSEEKKVQRSLDILQKYVSDAEYLFAFGRQSEGQQRLVLYEQLLREGFTSESESFRGEALDLLLEHYERLFLVSLGDPFSPVKRVVQDVLLEYLPNDEMGALRRLALIRSDINDAYAYASTRELESEQALQRYFDNLQTFFESGQIDVLGGEYVLSQENQIVGNLLRQYPQFYHDRFFERKSELEENWLKGIPEGPAKDEERQTLISTKIDFLKQLQSFFLREEVSLTDARIIVTRLLYEIRDLEPENTVGVSNLFALRLEDYGAFLHFLDTTNDTRLRGSSPQQEYDAFLLLEREQLEIGQVLDSFLDEGQDGRVVTSQQLKLQILENLQRVDIEDVIFVGDVAAENERVTFEGRIGEIAFEAAYDWRRQLLYDVRYNEQTLSSEAVRLNNLKILLDAAQRPSVPEPPPRQETPTPDEPEPPISTASQAERVAKILLLQKLSINGILAQEENIVVNDLDEGIFVVNGATLSSNDQVQTAFIFDNSSGQASSIIVRTPQGDFQVQQVVDIANLARGVEGVYVKYAPVE